MNGSDLLLTMSTQRDSGGFFLGYFGSLAELSTWAHGYWGTGFYQH